jgi:RNA polymerase sigma-70 factor (ECF subfamily)
MAAHDYEQESGRPPRAHWFTTTHWSVVLAAGDGSSPRAHEALEDLCRSYWYPLYAYVRRHGYSPEDAQDLTQEFFARFLENNSLSHARRERGRFRNFLLTSLQNFLSHEWERGQAQKRGGGRRLLPWDELTPEIRYRAEADSEAAPDRVFEERWASTLFQQALTRLRQEFVAAGKGKQFDELKVFLSAEAADGDYDSVATRLNMTPKSVAVAVHRLRKRYGDMVRQEIANTVSSPAEIEDEMRHLIELVGG